MSNAALIDALGTHHAPADVPARIRADDVCLRQILINLLGNAVKFTEDGGIRVYISFADGRLVISVADTGAATRFDGAGGTVPVSLMMLKAP